MDYTHEQERNAVQKPGGHAVLPPIVDPLMASIPCDGGIGAAVCFE
jgi:hypothetical protein